MELTNRAEFHKQHKAIHYTFHECSTYKITTNTANNSYRQQQGTYIISGTNLLTTKQHGGPT